MASTWPAAPRREPTSTPYSLIAYVVGGQVHVVARAHRRDDDAEVGGELAAQRLDPVEQVAATVDVDQVDEVGRELELERVDRISIARSSGVSLSPDCGERGAPTTACSLPRS